MNQQYDKRHAVTLIAAVALAANRFASYGGGYASGAAGAGGLTDSVGVTEYEAKAGEAVSAVTSYSYLVEASVAIPKGVFVKPGADGKAAVGSITDHCGRALEAATAEGQLVEVQILPHVHPTAEG
ncbi:hypothetical protein BRI6_1101 [plant metagenome]|uniref:Phage protein n=1 Tax=plant metagenome TaxID=1297885 RepID=A0A484XIG2_9ZZZZ